MDYKVRNEPQPLENCLKVNHVSLSFWISSNPRCSHFFSHNHSAIGNCKATLQIYTTTLLLFYILKDVLLQPNEATNIGCTPIQLLYNYYTANSSIYYNILYEQLIFVRITAIGSTRQVCTSFLQLKRCTLSLSTAG